jgi:hypothetical protein
MRRQRKLFALLCIALIALAAVVPAAAGGGILAFLMPVWLEFQPELVVVASLDSTASPEQPVPLQSLFASRAPPASFFA